MNTSDYQTSKKSLSNHHPNFTVLLGDNFYDYGVSSVNDSLWGLFDSISHTSPIFYAVLGNHDYGQSINSQIYYTQINPIWAMPARYFYKLIPFGHQYICAIFFDSYDIDEIQINWLYLVLNSAACQVQSAYRIVFTHYPIHTVGIFFADARVARLYRDVKPVLEQSGVHAYVCGHEHDMQAFKDGGVTYLTAGSFSENYGATVNFSDDSSLVFRNTDVPGYLVFILDNNESMRFSFINSRTNESIYTDTIRIRRNQTAVQTVVSDEETRRSTRIYIEVLICLIFLF